MKKLGLRLFVLIWLLVTVSNGIYSDGLSRPLLLESLGAALALYVMACIVPFVAAAIYYAFHKKSPRWTLWPAYVIAVPLLFATISHGEAANLEVNNGLLIVFIAACVALTWLFYLDFSSTRKAPDKKEPQKPLTPRPTKPLQTTHIDEYAVASKIAALISQTAAENPSALSEQSTYSIALNQDGRVALVKTSFVELLPSQPIAVVAVNQIEGRDAFQNAVESGVFLEQEIDVFSVNVLRALLEDCSRKSKPIPPTRTQRFATESDEGTENGTVLTSSPIYTDKRFVTASDESDKTDKKLLGFLFGGIVFLVVVYAANQKINDSRTNYPASTSSDATTYQSVEAPEDAAAAAQDSAAQAAAAATDAANAATEAAIAEVADLSRNTLASGDLSMDGFYLGYGDNAGLGVRIEKGFASVEIIGEFCVGGMDGSIRQIYDNYWKIESGDPDYPCEISMSKKPTSVFTIDQGEGCTHYHGAQCGFSGYVIKQ